MKSVRSQTAIAALLAPIYGRRPLFLSLVAAVVMTAGCNSFPATPPLGQVKGKVTLDGSPAPNIAVVFEPADGRSSTGMTDKDGNYTLDFDTSHKGAMIGMHKVRMTKNIDADPAALAASGGAPQPGSPPQGPPRPFPARYNDQTILEADVKAGDNEFNFELTSNP